MPVAITCRQQLLLSASVLFLMSCASHAQAQLTEVVVGLTPTCPYGISACWGGAFEALGRLQGVESVARTPDAYNCTASVRVKSGYWPDPDSWSRQFKSAVGEVYVFRGIEVSIKGSVEERNGTLFLIAPALDRPISLAQLDHKLQWNFRKRSPRLPESDERGSYADLAAKRKDARQGALRVEITGPLRSTEQGAVLEVREFFPITSSK